MHPTHTISIESVNPLGSLYVLTCSCSSAGACSSSGVYLHPRVCSDPGSPSGSRSNFCSSSSFGSCSHPGFSSSSHSGPGFPSCPGSRSQQPCSEPPVGCPYLHKCPSCLCQHIAWSGGGCPPGQRILQSRGATHQVDAISCPVPGRADAGIFCPAPGRVDATISCPAPV